MYILPEQLHLENTDDCIPYSIDVNVINDLTNFINEIRDVFDVIDRKDSTFPIILEKVYDFILYEICGNNLILFFYFSLVQVEIFYCINLVMKRIS